MHLETRTMHVQPPPRLLGKHVAAPPARPLIPSLPLSFISSVPCSSERRPAAQAGATAVAGQSGRGRAAGVSPLAAAGSMAASAGTPPAALKVDTTLNPLVAGVKPSKTMALTDLATSMKEQGIDVSVGPLVRGEGEAGGGGRGWGGGIA